jgi:hypothetical protein
VFSYESLNLWILRYGLICTILEFASLLQAFDRDIIDIRDSEIQDFRLKYEYNIIVEYWD